MTNEVLSWRANQSDIDEITTLVDFLELGREVLKRNDRAEILISYHPETDTFEFSIDKQNSDDGVFQKTVVRSHRLTV